MFFHVSSLPPLSNPYSGSHAAAENCCCLYQLLKQNSVKSSSILHWSNKEGLVFFFFAANQHLSLPLSSHSLFFLSHQWAPQFLYRITISGHCTSVVLFSFSWNLGERYTFVCFYLYGCIFFNSTKMLNNHIYFV